MRPAWRWFTCHIPPPNQCNIYLCTEIASNPCFTHIILKSTNVKELGVGLTETGNRTVHRFSSPLPTIALRGANRLHVCLNHLLRNMVIMAMIISNYVNNRRRTRTYDTINSMVLSQFHPPPIITSYFPQNHLNIILPFIARTCDLIHRGFHSKSCLNFFLLPLSCISSFFITLLWHFWIR
jgi:hypothetical protein